MKKRGVLVLAMVIVCSLLVYFASSWQSRMYNKLSAGNEVTDSESNTQEKTSDKEQNSVVINQTDVEDKNTDTENNTVENRSNEKDKEENINNNATASGSGSSTGTSTASNKNTSTPAPKPTAKPSKPNLIIVDTITKKTILSVRTTFNGASVYDITTRQLTKSGIPYKSNVTKDYIRSIAGRTEKTPDPKSGWIFYVNGKKSGIGAKGYIPKDTDIIEWKFWKDAHSN